MLIVNVKRKKLTINNNNKKKNFLKLVGRARDTTTEFLPIALVSAPSPDYVLSGNYLFLLASVHVVSATIQHAQTTVPSFNEKTGQKRADYIVMTQ